jgi:putrescine transport system substrate-binding protein
MSDPILENTPPASVRTSRRFRSWSLALVLSLILVTGWATFLAVAPTPETMPLPVATTPTVEPPPLPALANQVRVLAWRNAIDADVLAGFAADTGLKVIVDPYDSTEQLNALVTSGGLTQDVALLSGIGLKELVDQNMLQPLTKTDLSNAVHINPTLAARTAVYDPGNTHSIPILWGTIGLAFNAAKLAERLGTESPLDSWSVLFDPAKVAKLADCGVQVIDSPTGVFPIALTYLGLPANSAKVEDTDAASRLWESIRPSIAKFSSADIVDNLATGHVCLALATSGDAYQARGKARTAGLANDIRYILPKEGTVVWYDLLAIPKDATNTANALRLIDYLMRPEVAARLTNAKGFGNAVTGAAIYVKPELKTDAALMPDLTKLPNVVDEMSPAPAAVALRNRFWQLINAPAGIAPTVPARTPPAP